MNEHKYTQAITSRLPKDQYRWKINDPYQGGVPDLFYEGLKRDLWIEVKFIKPFPKRDTTLIDLTDPKRYLSKLQQLWLTRRHSLRQDAYVLVGCEHGGVLLSGHEWQTPISGKELKERCATHKAVATQIEKISSTG